MIQNLPQSNPLNHIESLIGFFQLIILLILKIKNIGDLDNMHNLL